MKFILITNNIDHARAAFKAGVGRVMVDLEIIGKEERQKSRNAFMTHHSLEDVERMRNALPEVELMVRINPYDPSYSPDEIEAVLAFAPDIIMLPMLKSLYEVQQVTSLIGKRCSFIPLIEHKDAFGELDEIAAYKNVDELYLGLNDLSISLEQPFLFQPLAEGWVDRFSTTAVKHRKLFGFGGIGTLGKKDLPLPAEYVLAEHVRLGSERIILSRAFSHDEMAEDELEKAIRAINELTEKLALRNADEITKDHHITTEAIMKVADEYD